MVKLVEDKIQFGIVEIELNLDDYVFIVLGATDC
jgi:hypothetical protein